MLLLSTTIFSCDTDDDMSGEGTPQTEDCTIVGRWIVDGLNESTLYEFTDSLRYTIYSIESGEFGTIEEAIPNPNNWYYEGDSLVIDLNFGNFSVTYPVFLCDCNVLNLVNESGTGVYYKDGYNLEDCDE